MRKVKILSNEQGQCPYCNSMDIDYGCIQLEDDMIYYPAHCNECGRDFEEWYDLTFTGHNVGDGCCEEAADLIGEEIEMDEPDDEDDDDEGGDWICGDIEHVEMIKRR